MIQNRADGKLVELPEAVSTRRMHSEHGVFGGGDGAGFGDGGEFGGLAQGKLDSIGLEYTYMLTSQLESQRVWCEFYSTPSYLPQL